VGSRHLYKLLLKTALSKPASDTILYWETIQRINREQKKKKIHFEKPRPRMFRQYKSCRLLLRLRQWQIANEARARMQSHFAQKPRNPE